MKRVALVVVLVLALGATALGGSALRIVDAQCFADGTVVGMTSDLRLAVLQNDRWLPLSSVTGVLRLWRSPDDRLFAIASDRDSWSAVQLSEGSAPSARWTVPTDFGAMRFASLDGVDLVTHDRVYRLDRGGAVTDLGATPIGGSGQPLRNRAPEILASGATTIVCTGTSQHEEDNVGGSCREAHGGYLYRVDFGEPLCCQSDAANFTAPLVCGDALISAIIDSTPTGPRDKSQARALATGALLAQTGGAARGGSTCLDGKRALLVGKRDIRVVSVPGLRVLWRRHMPADIGAVATCGGTRAVVIPSGSPLPVQIFDLDLRAPERER